MAVLGLTFRGEGDIFEIVSRFFARQAQIIALFLQLYDLKGWVYNLHFLTPAWKKVTFLKPRRGKFYIFEAPQGKIIHFWSPTGKHFTKKIYISSRKNFGEGAAAAPSPGTAPGLMRLLTVRTDFILCWGDSCEKVKETIFSQWRIQEVFFVGRGANCCPLLAPLGKILLILLQGKIYPFLARRGNLHFLALQGIEKTYAFLTPQKNIWPFLAPQGNFLQFYHRRENLWLLFSPAGKFFS